MKKVLLLLIMALQSMLMSADTWNYIGQGTWEDPFWTNGGSPLVQTVDVEESKQTAGVYRVKFLWDNTYTTIHCEKPNKVYVKSYTHAISEGNTRTVEQICVENGWTESYYGTFNGECATIPGDAFMYRKGSASQWYKCDSKRKCVFTLPRLEEGVYMGIISFKNNIDYKPISILTSATKDNFTSFVDQMTMGNATLLYYAVDQAIDELENCKYPDNLTNAVLVTFTDGLDQGSLGKKPEYRTSRGYASYLSERIKKTKIRGLPLQAYTIGLKSDDVVDDDLFNYNLQYLSSSDNNVYHVNNMAELLQKLTVIFDNLNKTNSERNITISVPMLSHGDKYRFTLDGTKDNIDKSKLWFEGTFNIDNMSLENVSYYGFTSTSGSKLTGLLSDIYLTFTLSDCRRERTRELLDVDPDNFDEWMYVASRGLWQHNIENSKDSDLKIEDIKSSFVIMLALDASTSLGDVFPDLKSTANSFIRMLAGEPSSVENILTEDASDDFDINDLGVDFYNLQGQKVNNPSAGLYICKKGNAAKKILIK